MGEGTRNGKPNRIKAKVYHGSPQASQTSPQASQTTQAHSDLSTKQLTEEAKELKGTLGFVTKKLEQLSVDMEKAKLRDYVDLMQRPIKMMWLNFVSGLSRGVGIALGFTFFAATIVYLLQVLGTLKLPIVGDYIADIVRIVQRQLQINPY
jgi:hypothetical protein